jgi:hypothetical protein
MNVSVSQSSKCSDGISQMIDNSLKIPVIIQRGKS